MKNQVYTLNFKGNMRMIRHNSSNYYLCFKKKEQLNNTKKYLIGDGIKLSFDRVKVDDLYFEEECMVQNNVSLHVPKVNYRMDSEYTIDDLCEIDLIKILISHRLGVIVVDNEVENNNTECIFNTRIYDPRKMTSRILSVKKDKAY